MRHWGSLKAGVTALENFCFENLFLFELLKYTVYSWCQEAYTCLRRCLVSWLYSLPSAYKTKSSSKSRQSAAAPRSASSAAYIVDNADVVSSPSLARRRAPVNGNDTDSELKYINRRISSFAGVKKSENRLRCDKCCVTKVDNILVYGILSWLY